MPEDFQIFIKPVGAACNMRCSYCYYLDKMDLTDWSANRRMNDNVLEACIKQHFLASSEDLVFFSWHGGEPLLAGIDFYRKAVEIQKKYLPGGRKFINGIQTNGTLLDREWCKFFRSENFMVGISIDGTEELYNRHRLALNGETAFNEVIRGLDLLIKHEILFEVLCVVSSSNADYPAEIYNFFKSWGARYMTFLPLVIRDTSAISGVDKKSVDPQKFGQFLSGIFDEWQANDVGEIKIQVIEETLGSAFSREHALCIFKRACGRVPVIESNGNFYSCDHFVDPDHLVGNILDKPLASLLEDSRQKAFGKAKSAALPGYCLRCEYLAMCNGECPKNRFISTPDGEPGLNYLCEGYKIFFRHCMPFIDTLKKLRQPFPQ